jgi:hypothetical protein
MMTDNETDPPEATETDEQPPADVETPEADSDAAEANTDTFPREYVEKLRKESADHRGKAKAAEERAQHAEDKANTYAKRLHTALVAATGKLHDPNDLAYAEEHLADDEALSAAIERLLEAKPHLKSRRVSGDVGQGNRGDSEEPFSLLKALKGL